MMYTPHHGMNYIAQHMAEARLAAMRQGRERRPTPPPATALSHDAEAGALWRMLTIVGVMGLVAFGAVVAVWVGGL